MSDIRAKSLKLQCIEDGEDEPCAKKTKTTESDQGMQPKDKKINNLEEAETEDCMEMGTLTINVLEPVVDRNPYMVLCEEDEPEESDHQCYQITPPACPRCGWCSETLPIPESEPIEDAQDAI